MDCDQALDRIRPFFTIFIDGRRLTCISRTSRCYGKLQASISFALLAITCVTRWTRQCCNNLSRLIPPPIYRSSELLPWFGKIRLPCRTKADSLNRTGDIRVTNPLFYQLNYIGMCGLYSMWKKETWSKAYSIIFLFTGQWPQMLPVIRELPGLAQDQGFEPRHGFPSFGFQDRPLQPLG